MEDTRRTLARQEFESCKAAIASHHADAVLLDEGEFDLSPDKFVYHGWQAAYRFEATCAGLRVPIRSELYLFCYADAEKKWTVEYRFSYPQTFRRDQAIEQFLSEFKWTSHGPVY